MTLSAVPIIFTRIAPAVRLPLSQRLLALLFALGSGTLLGLGAWLHPDPHGISTHTQLGLHPCQFEMMTGLPCPSCGMTTSFAYFSHGNLAASFYTQPMGTVLAIIAASTFWVGLYVALTGRPVYRLLRYFPGRYYIMPLLTFGLIAWVWKIYIHTHHLEGWQ